MGDNELWVTCCEHVEKQLRHVRVTWGYVVRGAQQLHDRTGNLKEHRVSKQAARFINEKDTYLKLA